MPTTPTPTGVEPDRPLPADATGDGGFAVRDQHLRLTQVLLQDQTDSHNELVQEREWLLHPAEKIDLAGNLFVIEHTRTGAGQMILKLEPLPHARPERPAFDLRVTPRRDTGFDFDVSGTHVRLAYEGGAAGRCAALQRFQRAQRPATDAHRLPRFLSNTWGDRSRDARICHDFIAREIEAGARLGVEVVQIDDGWQTGITANSAQSQGQGAWSGFWRQPDFWKPHPARFPHGLEPLVEQAARHGMSLGLWYAPDSSDDFANWSRDAACLLGLHRAYRVDHIKIDGVHAPTAAAQRNLHELFATLMGETQGRLVFDLDVTAQTRPGYFGMPRIGPLFVENRYTDWHRYWPHQTLRNLWSLAWWVDPARLRMEFLNPARNAAAYPDDDLAPARYMPDALFATVFCSNPLGWFETSNLPPGFIEAAAPLVSLWKRLRPELFGGAIVPLGSRPDGRSWTGFASVAPDGASALVLAFRELSSHTSWQTDIPGLTGSAARTCETLHGRGNARWEGGRLQVEIADSLGYVLLRTC